MTKPLRCGAAATAAAALTTLFAVALLAALVAPAVTAHGAPAPYDQDTRLLADQSDDCGAENSQNDCRHADDLIALDVHEVASGGADVTVFVLWAEHGSASSIEDRLTFTASSGSKSLSWKTTDGKSYTATGFDSVGTPQSYGDSVTTRYRIEGRIATSKLGGIGAKISGFKVEAFAGGSSGDVMRGTCSNTVGPCVAVQDKDSYEKPDYTLRGATYYARLDAPGSTQTVAKGSETIVVLNLQNLLAHTSQDVTVTASSAPGVTARFHDPTSPDGTGYSDSAKVGLAGGGSSVVHLALQGAAEGSGTITLTATTNLGGRTSAQVHYTVGPAASGSSTTSPTDATSHDGSTSASTSTRKSPGLATVAAPLCALGAAAATRRRR